jgi:hypothetical protein
MRPRLVVLDAAGQIQPEVLPRRCASSMTQPAPFTLLYLRRKL